MNKGYAMFTRSEEEKEKGEVAKMAGDMLCKIYQLQLECIQLTELEPVKTI